MAVETVALDETDRDIILHLQADGRLSTAELGRRVHMSPSATAERVRRLEEGGVILGYTALIDPGSLGFTITAFLRLRYPSSDYRALHKLLDSHSEIVEAHHVTGEDCFVIKVLASSMLDLERISGMVGALGGITTSVVYSSPLPRRALTGPES